MSSLGRFAPTPSGRMHLGNLMTALIAWLSVKSGGGRFLLRIEDLDSLRCPPENADLLREDLLWFGLSWDEEQIPQSQNSELYSRELQLLKDSGSVYPCWCTRGDLKNVPNAPHASDGHVIYPGTCRNLSEEEREIKNRFRRPLWRLKVPSETISFLDGHFGPYSENLAEDCGDFILQRADGVFAYHLAVVADDLRAGVTEIVRGRDLLSSTPRQIYLYRLLGAEPPSYKHVPLLSTSDGRRLSKRDRDLDLGVLRERFRPEELTGILAAALEILPSPESCTPKELIPLFSWDLIPREDIVLDLSR